MKWRKCAPCEYESGDFRAIKWDTYDWPSHLLERWSPRRRTVWMLYHRGNEVAMKSRFSDLKVAAEEHVGK